jgi:hypothetical protein
MEIRMVPEVQEWLAEMRDRDPAAAKGVDEARGRPAGRRDERGAAARDPG